MLRQYHHLHFHYSKNSTTKVTFCACFHQAIQVKILEKSHKLTYESDKIFILIHHNGSVEKSNNSAVATIATTQ